MSSHLGNAGEEGLGSASTTWDITPTLDLDPGTLGVVRVETISTGAGATNLHQTVTDTQGHTWQKIHEYSSANQAVSLWTSRLVNGLTGADLVTITVDFNARFARAAAMEGFDIGPDADVEVIDVAGASGNTGPPVVALSIGAAEQALWIGAACYDEQGDLIVTMDGAFTTDRTPYSPPDDRPFFFPTFGALWGQWREQNVASDSWDCALSADRPWTAVLAALRVTGAATPEPPEPEEPEPIRPREYQEDFQTPTHGVEGTSVTRRPDAVSLDYLTARAMGPVDLGDDSEDHQARRWYVRAEVIDGSPQVIIARSDAGNTAWEAEDLLFSYAGAPIDELSLAFTEEGWPVVACERPTGIGGAPEVWLYWRKTPIIPPFDPEFVFENLGPGRTPRVVLDRFPYVGVHCPPDVDVQLMYLLPGVGLKRREQRERFEIDRDTALNDEANVFLESLFPLDGPRVLRLVYSRRNPITGRYTFPLWLDSRPYANHRLESPSFNPSVENDLAWFFGEPWRSPSGSTTTTAFSMAVSVTQDVDSIELQGADSIPVGAQPDTGGIWTDAATPSGPVEAGQAHAFSVSVDHGMDTMSPNVFRARTKRTISGVECWSPWRYWFAALEGIPAAFDVVETLVNCERDAVVCFDLPGTFVYQNAFDDHGPNLGDGCPETPVTNAGACGGAGFFVGGWQPFPPLWRRDWAVQVRSVQPVNFSDPDGIYAFSLVGRAFESWQSGSGITLPDPAQSPQQVPA